MEEAGMDHNRCGNCGAGLLEGVAFCANCGEKAVTSPPRGLAGVAVTVLFPAIIALVALAFAWPWVFKPSSGAVELERYSPVRDGGSMLLERYDVSGRLIGWESRNVTVVEDFNLLTQEQRNAVEQFYPGSEQSGAVKVMQVRTRILVLGGRVTGSVSLLVQEPRGEFLVGSSDDANRDLFYDTPILLLPAQLNAQSKWEGEGRLSNGHAYKLSRRVVESGPFEGKPGKFNNCLKVETRRLYTKGGQAAGEETLNSRYCAGTGLVEIQHAGEAGRPAWSSLAVSADGLSAGINPLPYPGSGVLLAATLVCAGRCGGFLGSPAGVTARWRCIWGPLDWWLSGRRSQAPVSHWLNLAGTRSSWISGGLRFLRLSGSSG